jgi:type II secretory pathway pseudopilin PulG
MELRHLRRGISITEVLVVMLIICVLVSIVLPVLSRARDRAKTITCASNLHQLYLAMKLYQGEFDAYPPNSTVWPAFKTYYPTLLSCPKGAKGQTEFHYVMAGSVGAGAPDSVLDAFRGCVESRQGDYPVVRDYNHLIPTNADLPDSRLLLVRDNGSFASVQFSKRSVNLGPCDVKILGPESNL